MTERIEVPGARGIADTLSEAIIDALIEQDRLPRDFDFRLLGIPREHRNAVAQADVMAALDLGADSGEPYLTGKLPDCVLVDGFSPVRPILEKLDDDYHMRSDLFAITEREGTSWHSGRAWALYMRHLNPELDASLQSIYATGEQADPGMSKDQQYRRALGRVVIRDEALLHIYTEQPKIPGHGLVARRMLRYLLLDNHPELGLDDEQWYPALR